MKKLLLPLIAIIILLGGCLTTDYNIRTIYDVDRYYEGAHSDSVSTGMKWNTPSWKAKNVKLWASAGVIITNPYNVFLENSWIKDIVDAGFKGQIFVEDRHMDLLQGDYQDNTYFSNTFYYDAVGIKAEAVALSNDLGSLRRYPSTTTRYSIDGSNIFPFTTAGVNLVLNPEMWKETARQVAYANMYLTNFAEVTTAIGDTKGAVKWGVCLNDYTYQDWNYAHAYYDSLIFNPITAKVKPFEQWTPTEIENWIAPIQTAKLTMFKNAGIDVLVRGNRTSSLLRENPDLQNKLFMGQFIEDLTTENIAQVSDDIVNIRSVYGAGNEETAFMFIAGIKNDVYHQSSPTEFANLIKSMVDLGIYFTSGSDNKYWDAPKKKPGNWWIRSSKDSNWQANSPTYPTARVTPRKIIVDDDCAPVTGTRVIGNRTYDHTLFVPPSNYLLATAGGDTGIIDFSIVYDETTEIFHVIGIPPNARTQVDNISAWFLHLTSTDLTNWGRQPNINLFDPVYARSHVFAPHIIKVEDTWYMFYTAVDEHVNGQANGIQRIMLTTSTDLYTWTTGTLSLNGNWFKAGVADFTQWADPVVLTYRQQCRDPFVMRNENDNGWLMYVTVAGEGAAWNGGGSAAIVAIAESLDSSAPIAGDRISSLTANFQLYDWITHTSVTDSGAESPHVWREGNVYYLHWTTNQSSGTTGPWIQGARAKTTTPSKGNRQGNTWGTQAQVVGMPYKATEMIATKSDVRFISWLAYHPYNNNGVYTDRFGIGFKTYKPNPYGTDVFTQLVDPACFDPITIMAIPETPTGLLATAGDGMVTLTWDEHITGDVFSYNIYKGTSPAPTTLLVNTRSNDNTWIDMAVVNGTRYYYIIKSVNHHGTSSDPSLQASTIPVIVEALAPIASFTVDSPDGAYPLLVNFIDTSINTPTAWSWDFGDGGTSTLQNPQHTYATDGSYTVALTVTNSMGSSTDSQVDFMLVYPTELAPVATFVGRPVGGTAPLTVNFYDGTTRNPTSWAWTFGDGGTSTQKLPTHIYTAPGTYTVGLTATNVIGSSVKTLTNYITVTEQTITRVTDGLVALYTFNEGTGTTVADVSGVTPALDLTVEDETAISWGAGFISIDTPTRLTSSPANKINEAAIASNEITVEMWVSPFVASQPVSPYFGPARMLTLASSDIDGNIMIGHGGNLSGVSTRLTTRRLGVLDLEVFDVMEARLEQIVYTRSAGGDVKVYKDGVLVASTNIATDLSAWGTTRYLILANEAAPSNRPWFGEFHLVAIYDRALTAGEISYNFYLGAEGDASIPTHPPIASFTGTPLVGDIPFNVQFTDASTHEPTSWLWNFGDLTTSTSQNPLHSYTAVGSYTVTLTATNADGSDTMTRTNYVVASTPSAPVANFTGTPTSGGNPLTVQFTDTSANIPTSWAWTFGDGVGTSTLQNPSYQYTSVGTYTVTLTATNALGSNQLVHTNYITVTIPSSLPTISTVTGGTLQHGEAVTISGSGFGTKSTAGPMNFSDFEGGTVGNTLGTDGYWSFAQGSESWTPPTPTYSTDFIRTNVSPKSAKFPIPAPAGQRYLLKDGLQFPDHKIYLDYWTHFSHPTTDPNITAWQIKSVRFGSGTGDSNEYPGGFFDHWVRVGGSRDTYFETRRDITNGCNPIGSPEGNNYGPGFPEGTWSHIQLEVFYGDANLKNGTTKYWVNGVVSGVISGIELGCPSTSPSVQQILVGGYLDNRDSGIVMSTTLYYDDFYIDNTYARVEIGNASTYSACTHREIQIPTAWSDGSASVTINVGSFGSGASLWLFVVDSTGSPSSGFPIVTE